MILRNGATAALALTAALWCAPALADGAAAPSAQTAQTAPATPAVAAPDRDKVVCRTMPAQTGSRIGQRRICRTQHEWDDIRQQAQEATNRMELRQANPNP